MTAKVLGTIIAAVIVIGGALLFWAQLKPISPTLSVADMHWQFTDRGESAGVPQTNVMLVTPNKSYDLGTHTGSCTEIDGTTWTLQPNELSGVICYFAGGGDELGVFTEGNSYVIKQGGVDEGSAETPGTRGPYTIVMTLGNPN